MAVSLTALSVLSCSGTNTGSYANKKSASLANSPFRSSTLRDKDLLKINSLVVLPIDTSSRDVLSPVGAENIYHDLHQSLSKELELKIIAGDDVSNKVPIRTRQLNSSDAIKLAAEFGADAALVTSFNSYQERSGSRAGTEQPAKVDFSMSIYRTSDGREVWQASYHFSDDAWTDNLFQIAQKVKTRQGRGFLTAGELVQDGFDQAAKDFNQRRRQQFSK
ncbi:MAG: hypothetical protein R3A13_03915 [Bdellovibrionota bacterium]